MDKPKSVIRETDAEAISLGKRLIREARFGALAALDPTDDWPLVSRVGVAADASGAPLLLVSELSLHTKSLMKNARCSLLLGEPGKGDPLTHPRITLVCEAVRLARGAEEEEPRRRYLAHHPKAKLYASFADFCFFRLDIVRANLNGGFGKAYLLTARDLLEIA